MKHLRNFLSGVLFLLCTIPALSQGISVRNNLLWDATGTANIGIEIPTSSEHWTIGANAAIKTWPRFFVWDTGTKDNPRHWKYFTIAPELRYWPEKAYEGWFYGADLIYTHYNAGKIKLPLGLFSGLEKERRQGDFYGAGVFAGHSWWLSDNFRIEAEAGIGAGYKHAKKYDCVHCGAELGTANGLQLVPKLGINLAWNLTKRNKARKEVQEIIAELTPVVPVEVTPVETVVEEAKPEEKPVQKEQVEEVLPVKSVAEVLAPEHKVLHPIIDYVPYSKDMVIRKMDGALFVYYEFSSSAVKEEIKTPAGARSNTAVLEEVVEVTRQIMADTASTVSKIQIVGLASFEGGRWGNERLSLSRAQALKKYIQDRIAVPDDRFELDGAGEAWTDLRDALEDFLKAGGGAGLSVKELETAIDIIDKEKDLDLRETKLKAASGGTIYNKIRRGVFADQRSAGYLRIYYDVK